MHNLGFDVAHLLAGSMLALSFVLLYQDRITAVLNVFALQAIALSLSVAWQAHIQDAPHLFVTAAIALAVKGAVIPMALHRIVRRLGIHREIETAADKLRANGAKVIAVQTDLATRGGVDKLYDAIRACGRPVDALLANAGRGLGHGFLDQDPND